MYGIQIILTYLVGEKESNGGEYFVEYRIPHLIFRINMSSISMDRHLDAPFECQGSPCGVAPSSLHGILRRDLQWTCHICILLHYTTVNALT